MSADALKRLWTEAFGDTDEAISAFFTTGFSPARHHSIWENGSPVSALYWFDCFCRGQKIAYLYAIATAKEHRGKGYARRLMDETHSILQSRGYTGAILVPATDSLFEMYRKMGYHTCCCVKEFSCNPADTPAAIAEISAEAYVRLRSAYLPEGSAMLEQTAFLYLQTYARFYRGEDFLLCAAVEDNTLNGQELLGNTQAAPHILRTLNVRQGRFRAPGTDKAFAMFLPLTDGCPAPAYFALALD